MCVVRLWCVWFCVVSMVCGMYVSYVWAVLYVWCDVCVLCDVWCGVVCLALSAKIDSVHCMNF